MKEQNVKSESFDLVDIKWNEESHSLRMTNPILIGKKIKPNTRNAAL